MSKEHDNPTQGELAIERERAEALQEEQEHLARFIVKVSHEPEA